jgi:hypothetical protein
MENGKWKIETGKWKSAQWNQGIAQGAAGIMTLRRRKVWHVDTHMHGNACGRISHGARVDPLSKVCGFRLAQGPKNELIVGLSRARIILPSVQNGTAYL